MEVMEREGLVENSDTIGRALGERLDALAAKDVRIVDTRGLGLMRMLEFDRPCAELVRILWDLNVFAPSSGKMLFLCPPLCLEQGEMEAIMACLEQGLGRWK